MSGPAPSHHSSLRRDAVALILADVDGTIVGSDGVHASTWDAIADAHACGLRVALLTGRIAAGEALALADRLGPGELHIFCSGAVIAAPHEPAVLTSELPAADGRGPSLAATPPRTAPPSSRDDR